MRLVVCRDLSGVGRAPRFLANERELARARRGSTGNASLLDTPVSADALAL